MRILTLLLLLLLPACTRNSQQVDETGVQMEVTTEETLVLSNDETAVSTLTITLHETDGRPIDDAYLTIKGDMTHAGMMPVIATADGGTDGVYIVPFAWTMSGDWVITVVADVGDGRVISRTFPFTIE